VLSPEHSRALAWRGNRVQNRRDTQAAMRLLCKLMKRQCRAPRVMITDKLASYGAARREVMPSLEHRKHKGRGSKPGYTWSLVKPG